MASPVRTAPLLPLLPLLWALAAMPRAAAADEPPPRREVEGAIGLQGDYTQEYLGGRRHVVKLQPGIYLRWGRYSLASSGNFRNRRDDEVIQGLGAELIKRDTVRLQLGLRYDRGRRSSSSAALSGLDDIRPTLRARVAATWEPTPGWRTGLGGSFDMLGRGGGGVVDLSLVRERRWSPQTTWALGGSLAWADGRYLRSRFGVSAAESARSGLAAYEPGAGPLSASLGIGARTDLGRRWSWWWGASATRLLGPAVDSPLTGTPNQGGLGAGFAWRF